jgi:hypothetical protein
MGVTRNLEGARQPLTSRSRWDKYRNGFDSWHRLWTSLWIIHSGSGIQSGSTRWKPHVASESEAEAHCKQLSVAAAQCSQAGKLGVVRLPFPRQ